MAPAGRRSLKRESTAFGLQTPDPSSHPSRTPTPIKVEIDLTVNTLEDPYENQAFPDHGLQMEYDRTGQTIKQQRRSTLTPSPPSIPSRTSRPTPSSHSQHQPTVMRPLETNSLEIVGRDAKRLIDTIEQLKKIGLQSVDTELPELVLVGDQSAGKSSLMGAIAGINLPKGQSMCTRCPTNIKTSQADTWRCVVSLQLSYFPQKTRNNVQFPGWVQSERPMETKSFMTITHKSQLEEALKMAQVALLNPSQDVRSFIPGNEEYEQRRRFGPHADEAKFSPNVISVEIYGPGLPDLSFYDLPGLFQNAEDTTQEYLIKVFENMTQKYIRHKNALIICTITMQNDPGLSRTKAVITANKAEGRCIGVLTMPDRLQASATAHLDYDNIFKKQKYVLPLGYFVTKQPGADAKLAAETYHDDARKLEKDFFDTDPLWREGGQWHPYRDVCGTAAIQKYLSKQFASLIWNSIPDLTQKINNQSQEVDEQLALLPEVPNDRVQHIVRRELHEFSNRVQELLANGSTSVRNSFHSEWKKLCHQFLLATEVMRPGCVCKANSDNENPVIVLDDESDDGMSIVSTPRDRKRGYDGDHNGENRVRGSNSSSRAAPNNREYSKPPDVDQAVKQEERTPRKIINPRPRRSAMFQKLNKADFGPFYQGYLDSGWGSLSIMQIRSAIESNAFPGIPGFVNHRVRVDYALKAISAWSGPLDTFITCTFEALRKGMLSILESVLEKYIHTELYRSSKRQVEKFLDEKEKEQRKITREFFETERTSLFTINDESFNRYKQEALDALTAQRRKLRLDCYVANQIHNGVKVNDEEKFKNSITDQQLGPDKYSKELSVAAYIRGYYTTARIRFTDTVCANMNARYFQTIKLGIVDLLEDSLGLNDGESENTCRKLLEGNAEISIRRNALKLKKEQLLQFTNILNQLQVEFNRKHGDKFDDETRGGDAAVNGYYGSPPFGSEHDPEESQFSSPNKAARRDSSGSIGPSAI
ncbi:P-loop containing nucleoside triphosphate hydrolase protein [Rhexocercosporidium sp. MPI-PUGE-AT-0058]|nr:P-loop containing nucleoside triphosphate hydrolase protein [Rhexocercosporidium sp. MPI-PUGE-AT-0058]